MVNYTIYIKSTSSLYPLSWWCGHTCDGKSSISFIVRAKAINQCTPIHSTESQIKQPH